MNMKKNYIKPLISTYKVSASYSVLTANHGAYSGTAAFQSLVKERDDVSATEGSEIFGNDGENSSANGPWETLW